MSKIERPPNGPLWREIDRLRSLTVMQLRGKYREAFHRESLSNNKPFLLPRIAWRLQANAEGDLSERARQRARVLAEEADLRIRAPQAFLKKLADGHRDARLPAAGTLLTRQFRGQSLSVEVLEKGFRYQEQVYRSLSAVAREVTGVQWNGFAFFTTALKLRAEPRRES